MKTSWSLSCFGSLGKRGKTISGNLNATVVSKKTISKKIFSSIKRKNHVKSKKNIDGKVRQTFLPKKKKIGKVGP